MRGGVIQRGVLLIKFTETLGFFMNQIDVRALLRFFRLVLEPSSSGYCLPEILFWTRFSDPILVMASEPLDREFLHGLGTNLMPIPIGASDWTDYRIFRPITGEREYDVIYVANLTWIKRVHVLLRALCNIARRGRTLKAVIVLSSWGGSPEAKAAFEQLLDFYGVRSQVTVLWGVDRIQLNEWVGRARVSVLLSRKEGSNKTLFESIFADTPVLLLRDNVGVNKEHINEHTGRLVSEEELPDALIEFSDGAAKGFSPRSWAMAHIAPEITTKKLEAAFEAVDPGGISLPLLVKVNSPEVMYMNPQEASGIPPLRDILGYFARANKGQDVERLLDLLNSG
jgi:glycosyltransferase involved in cell wall biosynthesis